MVNNRNNLDSDIHDNNFDYYLERYGVSTVGCHNDFQKCIRIEEGSFGEEFLREVEEQIKLPIPAEIKRFLQINSNESYYLHAFTIQKRGNFTHGFSVIGLDASVKSHKVISNDDNGKLFMTRAAQYVSYLMITQGELIHLKAV